MNNVPRKIRTWDFASRYYVKKRKIDLFCRQPKERSLELARLGIWTRNYITDLGPTFIKLAQVLSTRKDIVPVEITTELEKLQDQVPPIESTDIIRIVDEELGPGFFKTFHTIPYKSASLGQVHGAILPSGVKVAVKIQRPGVKELILEDIDNIIELIGVLEFIGVTTGPSAKVIFDESKNFLLDELDYRKEANNSLKFCGLKNVIVPRVYMAKVTEKVLIMEWVHGVKISEVDKLVNTHELSRKLVNIFVVQIMEYGVFHADPHPGNVAVAPSGDIILYDYGLVIELPKNIQKSLTDIIRCVLQRDTLSLVDVFIQLGVIIPTSSSKQDIAYFFDGIIKYLDANKTSKNTEQFQKDLVDRLSVEKPFIIPSSFIFLTKTFSLIEGICKQLDPEFNLLEYIRPYIQDQVMNSVSIQKLAESTIEIPSRLKRVSGMVKNLEKQRSEMNVKMNRIQNYTLAGLFLELLLTILNVT